jgi:hypothetical protein
MMMIMIKKKQGSAKKYMRQKLAALIIREVKEISSFG